MIGPTNRKNTFNFWWLSGPRYRFRIIFHFFHHCYYYARRHATDLSIGLWVGHIYSDQIVLPRSESIRFT